MRRLQTIRLLFEVGIARRGITLQEATPKNIFVVPSGVSVFIADEVMALVKKSFGHYTMDDENFNRLIECIDKAGSDRPMVPVIRIGAGPTEKSARFSVRVVQIVNGGWRGPECQEKEVMLTFTLPVSQIEMVSDGVAQMAAPLWLIMEKLKDKAASKWGAKSRSASSVAREFVPATLRATTSPRVIALKAWLETVRDELLIENSRDSHAAALLKAENERLVSELFQQYLSIESPSIQSASAMSIQISKKHGRTVSNLFGQRVGASRRK